MHYTTAWTGWTVLSSCTTKCSDTNAKREHIRHRKCVVTNAHGQDVTNYNYCPTIKSGLNSEEYDAEPCPPIVCPSKN